VRRTFRSTNEKRVSAELLTVRLSKLFNKLVSSYMEHWSLVEGKHFSVPLLEN